MKHSINVSLTRKFGSVDVNITLQGERVVESEKGVPEFDSLMSNAQLYFEHFIAHYLPAMGTMIGQDMPVLTKVFDALEIRVTMDKGKRYWKVATPEHQEFGIPFWPEHMKDSGIDPKLIPDEGHKCKEGTKVTIEMVDGKPKRVLKMFRE